MRSFAVATGFISVIAQAASDPDQHETRGIHDYAFHGCAGSPKLGEEFRNVFSTSNRTSLFPAICGSICHELYVATVGGDCYCAAEIKSPVDFSALECSEGIPTIWVDQKPEIGPSNEQGPEESDKAPKKTPEKGGKGSSDDNTITFPKPSDDADSATELWEPLPEGPEPGFNLPGLDVPAPDVLVVEEPNFEAPEHIEDKHDADTGLGFDELELAPAAVEIVYPESGCEEPAPPASLAPEPEYHAPQKPQHEQPPVVEVVCPKEGCEQTPAQEPECHECVEPQPPAPQVPKAKEAKIPVPAASTLARQHPAPTEHAPSSKNATASIHHKPTHQPEPPHEPVAPGSRIAGSVSAALMVCGLALLI